MKNEKHNLKSYLICRLVFISLFCFCLLWALDYQQSAAFAKANGKAPILKGKPKWVYIVIHHSATANGNARIFGRYHSGKRGMQNGLAYHFVIDNGTSNKRDGQIEIGDRWKNQLPGGHSKQQWVNESGIGICLVGNFSKKRPTPQQMRSLVNLVDALMKKYNIPMNHVVGHGKIKGEKSQCPGKYFPWKDFYSDLKGKE